MKKLLTYGAGAVLVAALALPALAAQPPVPAEPLKMALTSKPVVFDHAVHKDRACGDCHHQVNGAENYQKCATAGCHDALGQQEKGSKSYFRIAHDRKVTEFNSCLSCHFEVVKSLPDQKKAMTSCVGSSCHPKA